MHNAAFKALKINAIYKLFPLRKEALMIFLKNLKKNNIGGLNVTIPYKEKVIPYLNNISKEARLIGAVNTIKVRGNRLEGFNTDGEGFLRHLTVDLRFNPQGKTIAIIGAGGASRAIAVYLSQKKPKAITIYDIDKKKTMALVDNLRRNFKDIKFKIANSLEELNIKKSNLLVNASPVGMKESDPCLLDEKFMHKNLLVYDLIYNPKETKLLKIARAKGAKVSNGLGMLIYQGIRSFEIWTAQKAPKEVMQEALLEALKE
jgi:shikimate dehydrogenase